MSDKALNQRTLRTRFDDTRNDAITKAKEVGDEQLAARIHAFQFCDIRPKAASELLLEHASKLLGHTDKQITRTVCQWVGETVLPTKRKRLRFWGRFSSGGSGEIRSHGGV